MHGVDGEGKVVRGEATSSGGRAVIVILHAEETGPIIKPRWPMFKELSDEYDRRMKMKGRRI